MFSFLKFLNAKSDADKNKVPDNLSGTTLNLNSPEASALNIFHNKLPIAHKSNEINSPLRSSCKETVTSPGFSYRIVQRAREMRSTTPNMDLSNLSTPFTLENSLNGRNTINGNYSMRDGYDKKRKLMETLDNFGIRKRTRQVSSGDAFVDRRRKTITESNTPDRLTVMNGHNHRLTQPISIVMNSKNINIDNKKTKRHGDFETNMCHSQKKPKTRNNEILSSYSSSKFLLKSGQKRPYPRDHEDNSPNRKHCKSCTCCGSTVLLENDQNKLNKSDKTTETDLSDDLVTVAASRIFNRSGKTQVVKKITMKTILDEVFDDVDPVPYTSIDKLEEKKKNAENRTPKLNEIQPAITANLFSVPVSSATSVTTPSTQSMSLIFGHNLSENTPKVNEENKINTPLQFNFESPTASAVSSVETNNKQTNEGVEKLNDKDKPKSINNIITFETPKNSVQRPNQQPKLQFQSPEKNENTNDKSPTEGQKDSKNDKNVPSFQFTIPTSTPGGSIVNSSTTNNLSKINENNLSVSRFDSPIENSSNKISFTFETNEKRSTPVMQFGAPKVDDKQSTPVMQFGASKVDDKQSAPVMQFGTSKVDDKQSTPVMQFGAPKVDDKQSTPVMQFGSPKADDQQSTPVMQFGAPKVDDKQSTPVLQFKTTKDAVNPTSTSLFSFGNNQKSIDNSKTTEPIKFQFGSSKPDTTSSTESKNVVIGSNNLQNQNLFNFGKTNSNILSLTTSNPPKYDSISGKSPQKLQFGTLPTPVFGTSNSDQSKSQFTNSVSQSIDSQGPKLVFGQTTENKSATSTSSMLFPNNTANGVFQFNSSSSKLNDKPSETPTNSFQFSSVKTAPFGASAPQDKTAFQFSVPKSEDSKTQFSTPTFGSQNSNIAPFKFGSNDKPASFGNTFPALNQPLQFTNNTEKPVEPFKFGSAASASNTFQFNANKNVSSPVKFGQTSNTFSTPTFSGFGSSAPPQTTSFGNVQPSQPLPFGNMTSPNAAPTFGNTTSPPSSNTFGTNQGFQFGSTSNAPNNSSTFAFGGTQQPQKSEGAFNFNAASPPAVSPFQFGQTPSALSTPQFGGTQTQGSFNFGSPQITATVMPGSSQPLFSMGTAPAGERRKAKAVRRRQ
ncbi:nuclear pore complex protein Nup153-like isoform X3 [Sipha flava]|uniref:Nuclear pore complex protein Nup153-like isoform X3 n=1 Tax=Sipha flava TaxID=143950 RepID=A0A8B8FP40_9HEMI|nr:nuclear pore complex protein Nup153-like isoform X3 [Sipha flava]